MPGKPPAMKSSTASIWMVSLLCVAAGLGIYYFAFDRPAQQHLLAELEAKQQALAAKQVEIETRQKAAVEETIAHTRQAIEDADRERQEKFKQKALIAESILAAQNAAQSLQVITAEYHANHGRLPQSLTEMNLPAHWTPSPKIHAVLFEQNHVRIVLDNAHIKGSLVYEVRLHQDTYPDWRCSSPDIADINDFLPACRYTGG